MFWKGVFDVFVEMLSLDREVLPKATTCHVPTVVLHKTQTWLRVSKISPAQSYPDVPCNISSALNTATIQQLQGVNK